jgi:hypothetical protein
MDTSVGFNDTKKQKIYKWKFNPVFYPYISAETGSSNRPQSSPRSSLCSMSTSFHSSATLRRQSSNTLQVPGYADIGFLHHRNSIESGDRLTINLLRADLLRRRSLSSLQPQQTPEATDQVPGAGLPDWANFRPIWSLFPLGSFVKITEVAPIIGLLF